jgi:hypothetical protein
MMRKKQVLRDPVAMIWDGPLTKADQAKVTATNAAALRLSDSRAITINQAGPFTKSKLAWKQAVYAQGLQHRIVALADAISISWNQKC